MTRLNVYAGPAGFYILRGKGSGVIDGTSGLAAVLPGPAPKDGDMFPPNKTYYEIPIAIQDRSFNADGSLFYPDNRAFFEGLNVPGEPQQFPGEPELIIPFVPNSDIAPTWNPEAFFNVMVVNGVSWPTLEAAPARYRFRLLNGCNSRFLNLALTVVASSNPALVGTEVPFYQIGAEQGFLRNVVRIETGSATPLPGDGTLPPLVPAGDPQQALLMGLAERADVIVDFGGLPDGTVVRMINTAPDAPFGGFPDDPADPSTTGQVMEFVVNSLLSLPSDAATTSPLNLVPKAESTNNRKVKITRQVSLNEGESETLCVTVDIDSNVVEVPGSVPPGCSGGGVPFGPKEALLGTVTGTGLAAVGNPLKWTDTTGASTPVDITLQDGTVLPINVTENPTVGDTEIWEMYNFTADAHPIHLHLVRFEVLGRTLLDGTPSPNGNPQPWENGFKDTVISYPGEITRVKAEFDIEGLYVWHCHIVEHEDNEMMRPYVVSPKKK
jgi:FtsP/CotA-like multicopper oxidase with cupredoxin domain